MNRDSLRRVSVVFFWFLFLVLAGLFFTNDFGLVDISKSSIIAAVGVDATENEVQLTAQIAAPKPSQSGESVEYTEVQGSGETLADALNEINAKTGFYPKLQFCKLVLIGDSCKEKNIFQMLGCFYRKNYSELTASVAMCKGKASDMLAMKTATSDMTSSVIQRALADELKKSANVSSVDLKDIAVANFSKSGACYMPYVEANAQGTSEEGGNGDNVGGESGEQSGGSSGGESGGSSGGSGGESGGSGGSGGGSSGSQGSGGSGGGSGGEQKQVEFTARKTAVFKGGLFAGILDEQQSFALDILKNEIRLAVLPCDTEEYHYTLGLKQAKGGLGLKFEDGNPKVTFEFNAYAQIAGIKKPVEPKETDSDDKISEDVLKSAEEEIKNRLTSLAEVCVNTDCDFLGIKEELYKFNNKYYEGLKDDILQKLSFDYKIKIQSVN